jgi:hypothetical protein
MLHVKHVFGRDDKDQIARAFAAEEVLRKGTSAPSRWRPPFQRYKNGHGDPVPLPDDLSVSSRSGIAGTAADEPGPSA